MQTVYQYYSQGQWKSSESGETIAIVSPYLKTSIGSVQALTQDEVNQCIQSAKAAQPDWSLISIYDRAHYLHAWGDELLNMKEELATIMMKEVGKAYQDAIKEVERTADLIHYTVEEAIHLSGESLNGEHFPGGSRSKLAVIERVPLGVVLAISPFNYPVNLAAAKLAPALITGNTVIFKPATQGSISGTKMIEALAKTNLPAGVLNLVTGKGSVIGDYLIEHDDIALVTFTGGTSTGERIAQKAKMIPLVMELGGKDPAIICEDANLELAAKQIVSGAYSYSGQRCTAIKRVLVHRSVADELVSLIQSEVEKLSVGSPEVNATIVPLIDEQSADFVQGLIDDALEKGATLVLGNKREENLIYPTLLDHVTKEMRIAWEEPFGPVLPIIRVDSQEEAIEIANASEYGLQASVFTQNLDKALTIARKLETGSIQINGRTERGPDHLPFIGIKKSGLGIQGVRRSIESMTREKVIILNINEK
ncbi:NADP-dependent glyceraldehyde-3-phosphate dehydrogenase [Turicibacter bilis]|uniref:NADP-dependent glyceraldehyde-3-phosphate dehydrogenase n=1 Tax=Turicibacter bilis TaxID=2735723 RepID=UPI001BAEBEED|nr:NADP-dependent glyceraldehyde-3-phosphate dehydrogenase [Turicibacter bilis]MBS3203968.1 NADP-dependent glyceraldehyde-3-phosphate dehydrogenase [Turicibacter bilis]UUF11209.1 NADP-dependent glyceraldehyde-3-phosphate dehydrogenase [Turicibacter bilis]